MNTRLKILLVWTGALLFSSLACRLGTSFSTASPTPTTFSAQTDQANSCPIVLAEIMQAAAMPGGSADPQTETQLVTYQVTGEEITDPIFNPVADAFQPEQEGVATQKAIWQYFTALIPLQQRQMVSNYVVLTDGKDNILAAVARARANPKQWVLEVDVADSADSANLTFTIIHEFGHLLTLNADQVPPNLEVFDNPGNRQVYEREAASCSTYFPVEGCSRSDSYLNQFYQRFWKDIYPEWNAIDHTENDIAYYRKLNDFYHKYEDRFVSSYAVTDPAEDIAESWAYFVLGPKPAGDTIANRKVLFFYEYPELVQLRQEILSRLCAAYPTN